LYKLGRVKLKTPVNSSWPVVFSESMPNDTIASATMVISK
jgi:hypothetical protein